MTKGGKMGGRKTQGQSQTGVCLGTRGLHSGSTRALHSGIWPCALRKKSQGRVSLRGKNQSEGGPANGQSPTHIYSFMCASTDQHVFIEPLWCPKALPDTHNAKLCMPFWCFCFIGKKWWKWVLSTQDDQCFDRGYKQGLGGWETPAAWCPTQGWPYGWALEEVWALRVGMAEDRSQAVEAAAVWSPGWRAGQKWRAERAPGQQVQGPEVGGETWYFHTHSGSWRGGCTGPLGPHGIRCSETDKGLKSSQGVILQRPMRR